jgi:hypothetical protein
VLERVLEGELVSRAEAGLSRAVDDVEARRLRGEVVENLAGAVGELSSTTNISQLGRAR